MKQNIKRLIAFLTVFFCATSIYSAVTMDITVLGVFAVIFWIGVILIIKKILDSAVNAIFQVFEK